MVAKNEIKKIKLLLESAKSRCDVDDLKNARNKIIEAKNSLHRLENELENKVGPNAIDLVFKEMQSAIANLGNSKNYSAKENIVNAIKRVEVIILELKE